MREQRVNEVATTLGLETLLDRKPGALSGGQRQRVAMGRAMVREPKAFLMDEPLSNLDAKLRVSMRAELSRLHERLGVTTVYVTHDQVEAMTLGQRVAVMRDGLLQQVDTPQNLFHHPSNLFVAAFIGSPSMNLVDADVADGAVRFGSYNLALPAGSPMVNASRRVILGLRPTDFEHAAGADPSLPRMRVKADVVEELGAETHIIFAVDAPRVSAEAVRAATEDEDGTLFADDQRAQFTARVDGRKRVLPGDEVDLAVDSGRFHFFEPETGVTLASGALAGAALSVPARQLADSSVPRSGVWFPTGEPGGLRPNPRTGVPPASRARSLPDLFATLICQRPAGPGRYRSGGNASRYASSSSSTSCAISSTCSDAAVFGSSSAA